MVGVEGAGPSILVTKSNEAFLGQHFCHFTPAISSTSPPILIPVWEGARTKETPSNQVAYSIFGTGQGIAPLVVPENAPLLKYAGVPFATVRD